MSTSSNLSQSTYSSSEAETPQVCMLFIDNEIIVVMSLKIIKYLIDASNPRNIFFP